MSGLGGFRKRELAARVGGRNPATGEQIKFRRVRVCFTPAKALKELVLGVTEPAAKKKLASMLKAAPAKVAKKN